MEDREIALDPPPQKKEKIGRNDPSPCGSGKNTKKENPNIEARNPKP